MARELITLEEFESNFSLAAGFGVSEDIIFENKRFDFEVTIEPIHRPLVFVNCFFDEDVKFVKGYQVVRLSDNLSENSFDYADYETNVFEANVTFKENCEFCNALNAENIVFKENFRLHDSVISKINFENTKFEKLADFWSSTFMSKTIFFKTDFNETLVLSMSSFTENVLFTYTKINGLCLMKSTKFYKGLDLSLANISGDLEVFGSYIWDEDFKTINLFKDEVARDFRINSNRFDKHIKSYDVAYDNCVTERGEIPIENKRETYRILKDNLLSSNNYVEAVPYRVREYKALWVESWRKLIDGTNVSTSISNILITFLNGASNWFGSSYILGLIFTVSVGSLFFNLMLGHIGNYQWTCDYELWEWEYFVQFMIPTHRFNFMDCVSEKPDYWFYIWDFLGRIFVGYGIYQTIQAFRKFK